VLERFKNLCGWLAKVDEYIRQFKVIHLEANAHAGDSLIQLEASSKTDC